MVPNFQTLHKTLTPVVDTNIYASGDVFFIPTLITLFSAGANLALKGQDTRVRAALTKLIAVDASGQNADFDFLLVPASTTWGSINSATAPAASLVDDVLAWVRVTNYVNFGSVGMSENVPAPIPFALTPATDGSVVVYAVGIVRGTPTQTAADNLRLSLSFNIENVAL
jgi:hypothetical protein